MSFALVGQGIKDPISPPFCIYTKIDYLSITCIYTKANKKKEEGGEGFWHAIFGDVHSHLWNMLENKWNWSMLWKGTYFMGVLPF